MGVKISELTEASAAQSTDVMPIVQNGETKKIPVSVLLANLQTQLEDLESHVNDEIYFKSGDSYTFAAIECAGHLTSGQKTTAFCHSNWQVNKNMEKVTCKESRSI